MNHLLRAEKIDFGFSQESLLKNISFAVAPAEIVGLVGPNGSGKTTLLRVLSGYLKARSGTVTLADKPLQDYPLRERSKLLSMVPQESQFAFPFTVAEVVLLGRYPHLGGLSLDGESDRQRVADALGLCDLRGFEERLVTELSGGEKQRVVLARALAQNPRLLLLDEPTTFLDLGQQLQVCRLLRHLVRQEGLGILAVFHDLNLAAAFCDRLLVLRDGHLVAEGTPAEVMTDQLLHDVFRAPVSVRQDAGQPPYYVPHGIE